MLKISQKWGVSLYIKTLLFCLKFHDKNKSLPNFILTIMFHFKFKLCLFVFILMLAVNYGLANPKSQNNIKNENNSPEELSLAMPKPATSSEEISTNFSPEFLIPVQNPTSTIEINFKGNTSQNQTVLLNSTRENPRLYEYYDLLNSNTSCPKTLQYKPDFDALEVFPKLGFHVIHL